MEPEIVIEFRKRRSQTWHAIRFWVLLGIVGAVAFIVPLWMNSATKCIHHSFASSKCSLSTNDMPLWQINLCLIALVGMMASIIAITLAVRRHYRCPRCEAIPIGSSTSLGPGNLGTKWGVALTPDVCFKCGAKLR
jgi:hypothetical protein